MRLGVHICCVHEFPSLVGPPRHECEFGLMFRDDWTPAHLTRSHPDNGGDGSQNLYSEIALANNSYIGNSAVGNAGALYVEFASSLAVRDSTFRANTADGHGGAVYVVDTSGGSLRLSTELADPRENRSLLVPVPRAAAKLLKLGSLCQRAAMPAKMMHQGGPA